MKETFLRADRLTVGYRRKPLIRDICFDIQRGQIVALIGPNGAGKSTILKTLIRELAPLGGAVLINGRDMAGMTEKEQAKRMASMQPGRVPTEFLTVEDVVSMGRYPYTGSLGLLSEKDREIIHTVMDQMNIADLAARDFSELSDGQRQRVMLARAICQEPELLILDEPTSFLDIRYQLELLSALRRMAREQKLTVILSLHEIDLARRVADRLLCVKNGEIVRYGTADEIFTPGFVESLFDIDENLAAELQRFQANQGTAGAETKNELGARAGFSAREGSGTNEGSDIKEKTNVKTEPGTQEKTTGEDGHYVISDGKRLRCGFTTGTCAALAAQAGVWKLLTGLWPDRVRLITPKGWQVEAAPEEKREAAGTVSCAVRKDGGDDVDQTHGMLIFATVSLTEEPGIVIEGGEGIGRVTKPGLDQPVGAAAINSVPRRMIQNTVEDVCRAADYAGGVKIIISAPDGAKIAQHTFNPMLGIEGGISVLGTSGIVEPMSVQALVDTIGVELKQARELGFDEVILTPGNYGLDFLKSHAIQPPELPVVRCSNYIGEALDRCGALGFRNVLLVGHAGKLIKLAGGIMNTHSRTADCRTELFCAYAALCGADAEICRSLMDCATVDACIKVLDQAGLRGRVLQELVKAIEKHLIHRADGKYTIGALLFSNVYGELGRTAAADELIAQWNGQAVLPGNGSESL